MIQVMSFFAERLITRQNVFANNLEKSIGKTMLTSISITYITWEFILIMCFFSGTSELQFINIFRHQWITIDKHLRITETSPFSLLMVKLLIVIVSLYGCSPESVWVICCNHLIRLWWASVINYYLAVEIPDIHIRLPNQVHETLVHIDWPTGYVKLNCSW